MHTNLTCHPTPSLLHCTPRPQAPLNHPCVAARRQSNALQRRQSNALQRRTPTCSAAAAEARPRYDLKSWQWRGNTVRFQTAGCGPPIVLIHGFGMCSGYVVWSRMNPRITIHRHWRYNIPALVDAGYKVYALDLLGFGASDKPQQPYTMETWADLVADFMDEYLQQQPAVLVGNSIGSLVALMVRHRARVYTYPCLIQVAAARPKQVAGTVLVNCAGGMNNKAIADDWRIQLAMPIFLFIDWLLLQPAIARRLFDSVRQPANIQSAFQVGDVLHPRQTSSLSQTSRRQSTPATLPTRTRSSCPWSTARPATRAPWTPL